MDETSYDMEARLMPEAEQVALLISRFVMGALNPGEVLLLHQWMSFSDTNRALLLALTQPSNLLQGQVFFRACNQNISRKRELLARIKQQAGIPKLAKEPPYLNWWLRLATGSV